jgi:pimeloyl-ACP methyl ester carboxylesterase
MYRMKIVDRGRGVPLLLIPGIQGRWEYMHPALDALERSFRVITFPLSGERGTDGRFDLEKGLDNFVEQIDAVLDNLGIERAVVSGVSFGGLIALHYAAERPGRTAALILVSTPGPQFHPSRRHRLYTRAPRLLGPLFLAEIPYRVGQELKQTFSEPAARRRFGWGQIKTFVTAPFSLSRMGVRAKVIMTAEPARDALKVSAPTLIITGEPQLDYVVPADGTAEYAQLIPGAQYARIERTGHLGYITKPARFAQIVADFVADLEKPASVASTQRHARSAGGDPHAA